MCQRTTFTKTLGISLAATFEDFRLKRIKGKHSDTQGNSFHNLCCIEKMKRETWQFKK